MEAEKNLPPLLVVVRVRGTVNMNREVLNTLNKLKLLRVNSSTLVRLTPPVEGMLKTAKDYLMWGRINKGLLRLLLLKKGRLPGNRRLSDESISKFTKCRSLDEFVESIWLSDSPAEAIKPIKPVFRLTPPKGGFKRSIKKPINKGGVLGDWDSRISLVLKRMI